MNEEQPSLDSHSARNAPVVDRPDAGATRDPEPTPNDVAVQETAGATDATPDQQRPSDPAARAPEAPEAPTQVEPTAQSAAGDVPEDATPAGPPNSLDRATNGVAAPPDGAKRERLRIGSERDDEAAKPKAKAQIASSLDDAGENRRKNFPPPNVREQLSPELEQELADALGDDSLEDLINQASADDTQGTLLPESRVQGNVIKVHRDDVFVDLGGRNQGIVPLKQFETPPEPDTQLDLVISRWNPEDGLFECTKPGAAVKVANWDDVQEGTVVEVEVTGTNKGGLECEIASIRGFIPMGQIAIYRVEDPEEFLGQRLACVVTEANRDRRNLVLSHRAVLEREREATREKLLAEIAPGQIREGTVKTIKAFGAFVDLGGVDGLIHISQVSWDRVGHPSEVLQPGQTVKVRIEKFDRETGKIGLAYRDLAANPWDNVESKYAVGTQVEGTVSRLMDFGAFVKLEPGVEGLIHISELSHGRIWRPSDVVSEGQEVDVKVLSVDRQKQRIGLSLRALVAKPQQAEKKEDDKLKTPADAPKSPKKQHKQLKGGIGRDSGGQQFGLKW